MAGAVMVDCSRPIGGAADKSCRRCRRCEKQAAFHCNSDCTDGLHVGDDDDRVLRRRRGCRRRRPVTRECTNGRPHESQANCGKGDNHDEGGRHSHADDDDEEDDDDGNNHDDADKDEDGDGDDDDDDDKVMGILDRNRDRE